MFVAEERRVFEAQYGDYDAVAAQLLTGGRLDGPRKVRADYARIRVQERAEAIGKPAGAIDPEAMEKTADREARRYLDGHGHATPRSHFPPEVQAQIDELAATYVRDGAALEVMRLQELAAVYRAYQVALVARGALDFGEQIAAATQLFKTRPNILRRWQRQFRYILVDEFQDANIAQIELIELLGRTPDRPDNVMVVGDDDQSIYRFRGASFAAFTEFDRRFSRPPIHDPDGRAPGPPPRLRIEQNFRSIENVLTAANRLIGRNAIRFEPDKRLRTEREVGPSVELIVCAGPEDEAVAIVDAIRARLGEHPRWSDVAILYRKHKHREALVARLRDEDIPYTVVGGLSLFATPEIRDLEQGLRAIADPEDDVALTRMMTAGPWRLDALEILRVARTARFDRRHLLQVVREIVGSGRIAEDRAEEADEPAPTQAPAIVAVAPATQAKLRRLLGVLDELQERAWRDGPLTILDRYLELGGQVLDMMAVDTTDAHRIVANIASFMRFAADWQSVHPTGTLAEFVDYLGAYQDAGGELPTSVELTEDVEGVRLMTVYQAKGLEFRHVFVPCLLEGEWPTREGWRGYFPTELLREAVPEGDIHTEEERRLLYVAMTRAQETLTLTTQVAQAPGKTKSQSLFIAELLEGAGPELVRIDRTGTAPVPVATPGDGLDEAEDAEEESPLDRSRALMRRVMPLPSKRERRLALRLRATELVGLHGRDQGRRPRDAGGASGVGGAARRGRAVGGDGRRRGARGRPGPADVPRDRPGHRRRREPAAGRAAAGQVQLLAVRPVRLLPAALRLRPRLPHAPAGAAGRGAGLRVHRARGLRGVHQGAPRAAGPRRAVADPRRPGAALPRALGADRLRRPDDGGALPAARGHAAGQLLGRRAQQPGRGDPRGAALRARP